MLEVEGTLVVDEIISKHLESMRRGKTGITQLIVDADELPLITEN